MSTQSQIPEGRLIASLKAPDFVSLGALGFALAALAAAGRSKPDLAVGLLIIAMILDFLDGPLARRMGISRDFGRYLDGFVDVLIYLITPVNLLYLQGFTTWFDQLTLFLFVSCGVIRLSVFNEIGNVRNDGGNLAYLGMPVLWSVFYLAAFQCAAWFIPQGQLKLPVLAAIICHSALMLIRRPFFKFKAHPATMIAFLTVAALFLFHAQR